jgi:hypothetical protein
LEANVLVHIAAAAPNVANFADWFAKKKESKYFATAASARSFACPARASRGVATVNAYATIANIA